MARAKKGATQFQIWFEEAWEGWIRPLGLMLLLAIAYLLYKYDILNERQAGLLAVLAIVGGAIATGVTVALPLVRRPWQRALLLTMAGVGLVGTLYPPLHQVLPGPALAQATLTASQAQATLTTGKSGPYDLVVSGQFKQAGGDADASYTFTLTDNAGGSDRVSGDIERQNVVIRSRKGTHSSLEEHNEATYRLAHVRGPKIVIRAEEGVDEQLTGLTVALYRGGLPAALLLALGLLATLLALVLDTRLIDEKGKNKSYLTVAMGVALAFSLRYPLYATSRHLVGPAVSEALWALVVGGLAGWALGGLARLAFGPRVKKAGPARRPLG